MHQSNSLRVIESSKHPNWCDVFATILQRGKRQVQWAYPEHWLQAELFVELERRASQTGWMPLPMEVPYVTHYPVFRPRVRNSAGNPIKSVKWVDLCLHTSDYSQWLWLELKIRHDRPGPRQQQAERNARDAFAKDTVALLGMDISETADIWKRPNAKSMLYWTNEVTKPLSEELNRGQHSFISAVVQVGGELNNAIWAEPSLKKCCDRALEVRSREACVVTRGVVDRFDVYPYLTSENHLVLARWRLGQK